MSEKLLEVKNLKTYFYTEDGIIPAVDDISFDLGVKETLGIIGESGCGKSITSLSIMRLIQSPPGKIVGGEIKFKGIDLLKISDKEMRSMRGNNISMIFQEPMTSLNPVFTVGNQIMEAVMLHQNVDKREARKRAIDALKMVNIPIPEKRIDEYPHQLSGGMRQRVMIAMALCCNPELLICDEPTTALDVTIQAQVLSLINELKEKSNTSIIMITHNFGVVSEVADKVMVMYAGKAIEYADVKEIFSNPKHPYTIGLMNAIPRIDVEQEELNVIKGTVPPFYNMPAGCLFNPRCDHADDKCKSELPPLQDLGGHKVRCWHCNSI